MDKSELTPRMQGALASLIGILIMVPFGMGIEASTAPREVAQVMMPIDASIGILAAFFIPLLWWRNTAGYIGAIGLGLFVLIAASFFIVEIFILGTAPISLLPLMVVALAVSVTTITCTTAAYMERKKV